MYLNARRCDKIAAIPIEFIELYRDPWERHLPLVSYFAILLRPDFSPERQHVETSGSGPVGATGTP